MGKKHKHEEHVNMEAWVISYADMVTLLFALFVVLYALGEVKLQKLKEVRESLKWAFSFKGKGETDRLGAFETGEKKMGDVPNMAPVLSAQPQYMIEFLTQTLAKEFEKVTGKGIDYRPTDDTLQYSAPLSAYFNPGESRRLKNNQLADLLVELVAKAHSFTSFVRVRIEAPNVPIGRDRDGTVVRSNRLCHERLEYLEAFLQAVKNVNHPQIITEFKFTDTLKLPPGSPRIAGWENKATLTIAFTNAKQ